MRERIPKLLGLISSITTGTLIACIVWYGITLITEGKSFADSQIPYVTLVQILSIGVICGVLTKLILYTEVKSVKEMILRLLIHYFSMNITVLSCGYFYGWYSPSVSEIIGMCLTTAAVYGFTFAIHYHIEKKISDELNNGLVKYKDKK